MSNAKFTAAKEFIIAKQYDVARSILEAMPEDETAKKWLAKLNELFPKPKAIEEVTDDETYDNSAAPAAAKAEAPTLKAGDLVEGTIVSTSPTAVTVEVGAPRDAIIDGRELKRMNRQVLEALKPGAKIKVYVVNPRNHNGDIVLSVNRALAEIDRRRAEEEDDFEDDWDDEEEDLELQIMSLDEEHNPNELAELRARLDELKSERFHNYDAWDENTLEDMFGGDEEAYDSWLDDN